MPAIYPGGMEIPEPNELLKKRAQARPILLHSKPFLPWELREKSDDIRVTPRHGPWSELDGLGVDAGLDTGVPTRPRDWKKREHSIDF